MDILGEKYRNIEMRSNGEKIFLRESLIHLIA